MTDRRDPAPETASPLVDGRFLLLETLGRGGMGRVYRAFDRLDQRLVAVKVVDSRTPCFPGLSVLAEFHAWSRLRHPNIVRAFEIGRASRGPLPSGTPYLVLEHFAGGPVHRSLRPGRIEPDRLEGFAREVLLALDHVHAAGLVHRDVKPGNVLVARNGRGRVKLTDFGLAMRIGASGTAGRVSGCLPYLSPEAILGKPLDGRADLYGLGILLFFLATGRLPVPSNDPDEIVRWHLDGPTADPQRVAPELPPRLARFIRRLTSRSRDRRPDSAPEALVLLGGCESRRSRTPERLVGTSELASLRLAVDAVALGGRRALGLPAAPGDARALIVATHVLAEARGLQVHRVAGDHGRRSSPLSRLVLRILLERGSRARLALQRHGLLAGLPVVFLGEQVVWDREAAPGFSRRPRTRSIARRLVTFLLEASEARAMAVVVQRDALRDPLTREVTAGLRRRLAPGSTRSRGPGGLLLVHAEPPRRAAGAHARTIAAAGSAPYAALEGSR